MLFLGTFFSSYSGIFCCLLGIRVAYVCIECVLMIHTKISIGCVLIAHYIKPTRKQKDSRMFFTCFTKHCNLPLLDPLRQSKLVKRIVAAKPRLTNQETTIAPKRVGDAISGSLVAAFLV